jgi:hypothetical protein
VRVNIVTLSLVECNTNRARDRGFFVMVCFKALYSNAKMTIGKKIISFRAWPYAPTNTAQSQSQNFGGTAAACRWRGPAKIPNDFQRQAGTAIRPARIRSKVR